MVCIDSPWEIRAPGRGHSNGKVLRQKYAHCTGNIKEACASGTE